MNTRTLNILIGTLFSLSGVVTLLEGAYNTRPSNIILGILFMVVGVLYFVRKRERQ